MRKEELSRDKLREYYKKTMIESEKKNKREGYKYCLKSEWAITIIGTASLIAFAGFFIMIGINSGGFDRMV